jgi:hypothetical protein
MTMRRVVLTVLAALVLVAFTFSGCKKASTPTGKKPTNQAPEKKQAAPQSKTETKTTPGQPTTVAPTEKQAAPADKPATPAPAPAPTEKPATPPATK